MTFPWIMVASLVVLARSAIAAAPAARPDLIQLADIAKSFGTPRVHQAPADVNRFWFEAW